MFAIIYGLILSLIHYFNDDIARYVHKYKERILSLGAGVSISYIFLSLFPKLYQSSYLNAWVFITLLLGFSVFHVAEKHVYQHKSRKKILKEMKEVHSVAFFIYHFLLGIAIFHLAEIGFEEGLFFFIPIFFHTAISNISLTEIHHFIKNKMHFRVTLAMAPLLGVLSVYFLNISDQVFTLILGFVIGALLYVVIRDSFPKQKQGNVMYYLLGVMLMLVFIVLTGQI